MMLNTDTDTVTGSVRTTDGQAYNFIGAGAGAFLAQNISLELEPELSSSL